MTFKALLKELFIGNETDLLEQLKNLDKKQRDNLNKEFKPIFSLIEEAQQIQHKKNFSYEEFYNFIKENPEKFITEQWEKIKKTGSLKYPKNYVDFMLRLQILKVGLYPQKEMKKVFKFDNYYAENTNNSNFILNMTNTLLARKEDWVKSFLLEFFENFEKWLSFKTGISQTMLELRKNYPEWKKELYYYAGKVMYYEGFFIQDNKRSNNDWSIFHLTFDSEMIVSGLEFDNFPSGTNITGIPIGNEFIMKKVFSVLKDNSEEELKEGEGVSRKSLLALTMKKLIQPMHIKHSGYWLDLFEKLNITEEELIEYKQNFVEMLTAKNSTIISLGIKKLDFFIEKALVQPKEVITELGYILFNESKSTVEEAFSYLKKIAKKDTSLLDSILIEVEKALDTPNKNLRQDILKWLKTLPKTSLEVAIIPKLKELYEQFPKPEQILIDAIFPNQINNKIEVKEEKVEVKITTIDLKNCLKKTKTRKNNFDKKWDYWENFLKTYEEKKILIPLEVVKPSYEFYKLEKNFTLYESAEILVDEMLKQQTNRDTILSLIEVEKILASCLFFKEEGNNEKIKKILDPINQLIELCNKPVNIYKESYPKEFNHNVAFMSLIAYVWQNNGNTLETPKNSPLESAYKSLYNDRKELFIDFVHYFKVKEIKTFLATPTHENGWVSPDIFIERLNAFKQENISISDFMKVLYKIPTIKEEHNKIWQAFENKLENFNKIISSALKIAFAPENIFNQEKNNLINHFTNNPPNACIAWDYYNTKPEIDNNTLAFYIFCASLRCRYGLEDLSQEIPELISKELTKNFTIKVGRHRNFEKDTFEKKIPFLKLFYHPEELSKSKKNSDGTFTTYFELYQRNPEDSMHYQFYGSFFYVPHLIAYGANLDNESSYPPIKQRLFERSVIYLTKFASRTTGTTTHLKKMGSPSYVNILPFIEDIIYPHKFSEHRNDIIELITTALFDGRITHEILAKTFAKKFELNDGSQYLDYLLEGLANFSSACKFITIYILEYLICNSFDKVTPKTSSIILDRYYNLLEANKIKPTTIEVLNRLELLAKGKKSVTKEKAQLLLLLEGSLNNLLEVEIVKSLVEES